MKEILGLSLEEFRSELQASGLKPFVARQVFQWLYQKGERDFSLWTNISRPNREFLAQHYGIAAGQLLQTVSDEEGTKKLLIGLADGQRIEAVLIPEKDHVTFCLSSQAGCPLGCTFCATGRMGFRRNLTAAEILAQILWLKVATGPLGKKINLVFMGMGEPLLNYDQLAPALALASAADGFNISPRHITVSSAGILAPLQKLEAEFPLVKIAFSLNAPDQELREQLMPHARTYPLAPILDYLRQKNRKHRITFEYVLLAGINDAPRQARQVSRIIHGIPAKINLIPFNKSPGCDFSAPAESCVLEFQKILMDKGHTVVVRWSKGRGIRSACGQLATHAEG